MSNDAASATLDRLAAELLAAVRRASTAQADAALAAQFEGLQLQVDDATAEITECAQVVARSPLLRIPQEERENLESRRSWVVSQIDRLRSVAAENPAAVRQGPVWRETRQAIDALRKELTAARAGSYRALLEEFAAGDRELLESVPPGTAGLVAYRRAIEDLESFATRQPRSLDDVAQAAAAGRRLRELREQVERDAVPAEFQDEWRALREGGLRLPALTDEFRAWLDSHGLAKSVVLTYRAA